MVRFHHRKFTGIFLHFQVRKNSKYIAALRLVSSHGISQQQKLGEESPLPMWTKQSMVMTMLVAAAANGGPRQGKMAPHPEHISFALPRPPRLGSAPLSVLTLLSPSPQPRLPPLARSLHLHTLRDKPVDGGGGSLRAAQRADPLLELELHSACALHLL